PALPSVLPLAHAATMPPRNPTAIHFANRPARNVIFNLPLPKDKIAPRPRGHYDAAMQSHFRPAALLLLLAACHQRPASIDGTWHATLASPGGELPFTLQISNSTAVILNGAERVPTSGVDVNGSQVTIRFDWYDSAIRAEVAPDGNVMKGMWMRT